MAPQKSQSQVEYGDQELQALSAAVLEHAARDAKKGDPAAAAFFLTPDAKFWGTAAGLEPGTLGKIAFMIFEELI